MAKLFALSRYGKGGGDDYLNVPLSRSAVRGVRRGAPRRGEGPVPRLREGRLLRGLPARRGDGRARRRDAAPRADEAVRPPRPAHGQGALRRRPAPAGRPREDALQPRRLPDEAQGRRAAARSSGRCPGSRAPSSCATGCSTATPTSTAPRISTGSSAGGRTRGSSSRASSRASRATSSPRRRASWSARRSRSSSRAGSPRRSRSRRRSARSPGTSRRRARGTSPR